MGIRRKDKRDVYYYRAKSMGYRARSAFKLLDIENTFHIFKDAKYIIDLCAAPGSWSQVLSGLTCARIIAIDVQEMAPIPNVIALKEDITSQECIEKVSAIFEQNKADLIVCDGAPDVTGLHDLDEYLQMDLLKAALALACQVGREGSTFVGKCFRGEFTSFIVQHFMKFYKTVRLVKPRASRGASMECFILCNGMKQVVHDPYFIEMAQKANFELLACGDGVDPDFAFENAEGSFVATFQPINPPYENAIAQRRT